MCVMELVSKVRNTMNQEIFLMLCYLRQRVLRTDLCVCVCVIVFQVGNVWWYVSVYHGTEETLASECHRLGRPLFTA